MNLTEVEKDRKDTTLFNLAGIQSSKLNVMKKGDISMSKESDKVKDLKSRGASKKR